jgi:hypothetical protein
MAKSKLLNDEDVNEIDTTGKLIGGILLIIFTIMPLFFMIALWPDRMPTDDKAYYTIRLFQVKLNPDPAPGTLHLNTIMFILVALAGFIGNMIHIATSFTNYVGSKKFQRSWILWYFVKPFSAAALAVIFYILLKAGLLNSDGANGANPFGIVILSALAGLFTDKAMLKLEEIFVTMFRPKDDRPGKIKDEFTITGITPLTIEKGKENSYVVAGEKLDKAKLSLFMNDELISNSEVTATAITFKYKVTEAQKDKTEFMFAIKNDQNDVKYQQALTLTEAGAANATVDEPVG